MQQGQQFSRIDWVASSCRLLQGIAAEFTVTRPFAGLTIGTAIHLEPKTAALLMTLKAGGARVIATGNLNSTQPATVTFLRENSVAIVGEQTRDASAHHAFIDALLDEKPDLLLDNGGDLFARFLERPYDSLIGGTEETTSGRTRLMPLRSDLARPILVINDSPIKQFAENRHGVGQSLFESYLRFTNRSTNGKRVLVFGYGACGKGTAACFRHGHSTVSVVDIDPVTTLEAHLDGFATPHRDEALRAADVIVTVTGYPNIVTAADMPLLKDGAILMNGGHFPHEIDRDGLISDAAVVSLATSPEDMIETLALADGRRIHLLAAGHMANLAGPRPLGNTIEAMDLGFAMQARCLERVASRTLGPDDCLIPVPTDVDRLVATAFLDLNR
ncbi:adenosylhomocysteinase [Rhizobium sp. TRM95796]|uniref:adenosylhomocysteinase n=1 Tax=Rhizobium sp. TRM95796 TaxID=2979862 RepID=UPI0021E8F30F|nr:adenosylhomocysteinase [Rhizobium sp. TRM95796]MCV3768132.1 adenosylhomocysteinase [Rhizobium sp. TRM95796]